MVDSNVLLDVIAPSSWRAWSEARLLEAGLGGTALINPVVVAEVSPRYDSLAELEMFCARTGLAIRGLTLDAAFRAGKAHAAYRSRGGPRTAILADFLIGAHAAVLGASILTRDSGRYAAYFPDVPLITPDTHPL